MTPYRMIALVLVVVLLVTVATPARAEAMEVGTIIFLVGVGVAVLIVVAYLIVANVSQHRRVEAPVTPPMADGGPLVLVAHVHATTESP
ncbi:MAG TPA: hypothetical protein VGL14_01525 [Methylomirabilota bacterium]|jgi:hypothetical protein